MSEANEITAALLADIPQKHPNIRLWRNNRIKAMAVGRGGAQRMVDAGINGQGDLSGIVGPTGRRLEIEVKAGRDRLSSAQLNFGAMIALQGGIYIVAPTAEIGLLRLTASLNEQERI